MEQRGKARLGKTQKKIYDYIAATLESRAIPPTVREICEATGVSSTATVHAHLMALEEKGMIRIHHGKQRSISLVSSGEAENTGKPIGQNVPIVGNVAAGIPILAESNIEETLTLPKEMLHGGRENEVFLLRVRGESMCEVGIFNGDLVVVHTGIDTVDGDIVVALVKSENSATVKRIYREKEHVRLQPENASMSPIYVDYSDLSVVGKVIGLLRRY